MKERLGLPDEEIARITKDPTSPSVPRDIKESLANMKAPLIIFSLAHLVCAAVVTPFFKCF